MAIGQIAVKVLKGHRVCEAGAVRKEGEIFFLDEDRLSAHHDEVEVINQKPIARNTMMESPDPPIVPGSLPSPAVSRLVSPRKGKQK